MVSLQVLSGDRTLIADAHITAIRKLLLPILPHILFAPPGPPLPSNHPSPSLLSKLYLHVAKLYDSSRALFKAHANEPSSSSSRRIFRGEKIEEPDSAEGGLNAGFKRYLKKEAMLSQALAHKWLAVDAGENGKGAKVGEAIAWCKDAQSRLESMEDSAVREKMKGLGLGKLNDRKKEERRARKGRVERDLEDVSAWVKSYTRQNDTVSQAVFDHTDGHLLTRAGLFPASAYDRSVDGTFWPSDIHRKGVHTACPSCRFWSRRRR